VQVFIHKKDLKTTVFKNDVLKVLSKDELPPIEAYTSIRKLYGRLREGKINVVFEPTSYTITDRIREMIQRRGVSSEELFKSNKVDPVIFWFEFMGWLVANKNPKFLTIIYDEADEVFPNSPSGGRWHLNLWAKDIMRDLRRRGISLLMASHGYNDIDGRLLSKIQYKIYMKGATTPSFSIVNHKAPIMLEPGTYYIERDGWGLHGFNKIKEQSIVLTYLQGDREKDDFGADDDDDEEYDEDDDPEDVTKPDKPVGKPKDLNNMNMEIPPDCIYKDKDGKLTIDFTKMASLMNGKPSQKPTKPKPKHKTPEFRRKSYIAKRDATKDNLRDLTKRYDSMVEAGKVSDVHVPKYDRNDNTTDEVDK
jgi:hypothetical protein